MRYNEYYNKNVLLSYVHKLVVWTMAVVVMTEHVTVEVTVYVFQSRL